jgi:hypothetical protein
MDCEAGFGFLDRILTMDCEACSSTCARIAIAHTELEINRKESKGASSCFIKITVRTVPDQF